MKDGTKVREGGRYKERRKERTKEEKKGRKKVE